MSTEVETKEHWVGDIQFVFRTYPRRWWQRRPDICLRVCCEGIQIFHSCDRREIQSMMLHFDLALSDRSNYAKHQSETKAQQEATP